MIEEVKKILDKGLQRCQEYPYKDWDVGEVADLILSVKSTLNQLFQSPEPKPDRLLTDEGKQVVFDKLLAELSRRGYSGLTCDKVDKLRDDVMLKAQDAKTASIKDAEFLTWLEKHGSQQQVDLFKNK